MGLSFREYTRSVLDPDFVLFSNHLQALSPVGVPSSQDEETVDILSGEMQIQKTLKMTSSQGEIEDDTIVVEYTEVVEFRRNCSLIRFVW